MYTVYRVRYALYAPHPPEYKNFSPVACPHGGAAAARAGLEVGVCQVPAAPAPRRAGGCRSPQDGGTGVQANGIRFILLYTFLCALHFDVFEFDRLERL